MGSFVELTVFDLDHGLLLDTHLEVGEHSNRHGVAVDLARAECLSFHYYESDVSHEDVTVSGCGVNGWWTDNPVALKFVLDEWKKTNLSGRDMDRVLRTVQHLIGMKPAKRLRFFLTIH